MAPPCPVLAGYRLVAPRPCACFPLKFVQEAACCSCVCRDLETFLLRFLAFHVGFLLVLLLQLETGLRMMMGFIFLVPTFCFSLLPAVSAYSSCCNDSILLGPFLGRPFYSFSQWPTIGTVLFPFIHGLLCPFVFFFWASTAHLLIFLGFPGPITLSLSLGFMDLP